MYGVVGTYPRQSPVPRFRPRIRSKFFLVLVVLLPVVFGLPAVGVHGLSNLRSQADLLYSTNLRIARLTDRIGSDLDANYELSLRLNQTDDRSLQRRLNGELLGKRIPDVERDIDALRRATHNFPDEEARVQTIDAGWRRYLSLYQTGALGSSGPAADSRSRDEGLARKVDAIFRPIRSLAATMSAHEANEAADSHQRARAIYRSTRNQLIALWAGATLIGLGAVLWLIRDIVPRTRSYSRFAAHVASGEPSEPIEPRGSDELADLGAP